MINRFSDDCYIGINYKNGKKILKYYDYPIIIDNKNNFKDIIYNTNEMLRKNIQLLSGEIKEKYGNKVSKQLISIIKEQSFINLDINEIDKMEEQLMSACNSYNLYKTRLHYYHNQETIESILNALDKKNEEEKQNVIKKKYKLKNIKFVKTNNN